MRIAGRSWVRRVCFGGKGIVGCTIHERAKSASRGCRISGQTAGMIAERKRSSMSGVMGTGWSTSMNTAFTMQVRNQTPGRGPDEHLRTNMLLHGP